MELIVTELSDSMYPKVRQVESLPTDGDTIMSCSSMPNNHLRTNISDTKKGTP